MGDKNAKLLELLGFKYEKKMSAFRTHKDIPGEVFGTGHFKDVDDFARFLYMLGYRRGQETLQRKLTNLLGLGSITTKLDELEWEE